MTRIAYPLVLAAAFGCSASSEPLHEPTRDPALTSAPAPIEAPAPVASLAASSSNPIASPIASTNPAGALAIAPPLTPQEIARGRCAVGMVEFGGGKFKSSYYRTELAVEPFCLDVNLATTDEYKACVESGKCDKGAVHACDPSTWNVEGRGKLPMICVDFDQADRYCKAQGKRIVSDLEWEWAARGGDQALTYPWGNDAPGENLCWSGKEKRTTPCPVGTFAQGKAGVFDLAGNIYQWTSTTNDKIGSFRIGRGGSWKDTLPKQVAIENRGSFKNTYRCGFLGIRCATAVP